MNMIREHGMLSLKEAIEAAATLAGQRDDHAASKSRAGQRDETSALSYRLKSRLHSFHALVGENTSDASAISDVAALQQETGRAALQVVQVIHRTAIAEKQRQTSLSSSTAQDIPLFGSRDLQTLRIVLGIVSNWCVGPLITAYDNAITAYRTRSRAAPKLQEIEEEEDESAKRNIGHQQEFLRARSALQATLSVIDQLLPNYGPAANKKEERPIGRLVLDTCSLHILAGHIRLGWGPVDLVSSVRDEAQQSSTQVAASILRNVPTHVSLTMLSGVAHVGSSKAQLSFVKATTEMLYAAQLLRPDGVMALLRNTFGLDDSNERGLMKKLASVGQLLSTPPARMPVEVFAEVITPRLLEVVAKMPDGAVGEGERHGPSELSTPAQKNAACFALARLAEVAPAAVSKALQEHVYRFIRPPVSDSAQEGTVAVHHIQLADALELIFEIVNQSEPSSQFVTGLLSPVCIPLFVLYTTADGTKQHTGARKGGAGISVLNDKGKDAVRSKSEVEQVAGSLIKTWLRLTDTAEAMAHLSPSKRDGLFALSTLQSGALSTSTVTELDLIPVVSHAGDGLPYIEWQRPDRQGKPLDDLNLLTLDDFGGVQMSSQNEEDEEAKSKLTANLLNALQLRPSPHGLTELLQQTKRKDVAASLLIALLDAYTIAKQSGMTTQTAAQEVLYIQHILRLIDAFGSDVLQGQPDRVLSFVDFALGGSSAKSRSSRREPDVPPSSHIDNDEEVPFIKARAESSALSDLMDISKGISGETKEEDDIIMQLADKYDNKVSEDDASADDEDEELVETALNLLLALLEANPTMTTETNSLLKVVTSKLRVLSSSASDTVRPLAKEASLVLSARQSAVSFKASSDNDLAGATPREQALAKGRAMYQEALLLLQDPILPVRAHGLVVLRDLASFGTTDDSAGTLMDPALTVAVLDIFVQAVCDDESFLYLNAVKGLAAMGTTGGHAMVRRLMTIYVGDKNNNPMTQAEVDKRLRVGEAMLQIVQKLEEALSKYIDDIVGPLLTAVRDSKLSTTLRTSMLSIIGTCIEACPQAMIAKGYAIAIADAMIELLRIEMDTERAKQSGADDALSRQSKLPQFRRAALLLLSLLVRGATMQLQSNVEERQDATWQDDVPRISALRMPGGVGLPSIDGRDHDQRQANAASLLFSPRHISRLQNVVGYVSQLDSDALTRHQASEVQHDIDTFQLYIVHSAAADVSTS